MPYFFVDIVGIVFAYLSSVHVISFESHMHKNIRTNIKNDKGNYYLSYIFLWLINVFVRQTKIIVRICTEY